MEIIITALVGIGIIIIGFLNRKGNVSMLHSYHTKRVTEEDKLPFGKLVGLGMIIIGIGLIISAVLMYLSSFLQQSAYETIAIAINIVSFIIGIGIAFYAMFKYNKGIF